VGDEEKCERDTMLSSPIILSDFPRLPAESPASVVVGREGDKILTLRIETIAEPEQVENRQVA
jgi:hypothetical protein